MRDEDDRAIGPGRRDGTLNQSFADIVEGRRAFVENQDRRVLEKDTGEGDPLLLASREILAAFRDAGAVSTRQRHDLVVNASPLRCTADLIFGRVFAAVGNILRNRTGEYEWVLTDISHQFADRLPRYG